MTDNTELFENMPIKKAIATMAIPTIISQLINLVYNLVDTFFIGRTGNTYMIAAASVAYPVFVLTIAFGNLFGIGGGSLMARLNGRGDTEKAKRVSAYSFYGAIAIALFYSLILGLFGDPILRLLGASSEVIGYTKQYVYTVVVVGDVPVILAAVMAHLLRNSGYSKQASIGLSMGGVINIVLDPLLMFVIMPEGMEVFGAALATLIANIISCIYLLCVYKKVSKNSSLCTSLKKARAMEKREVKDFYSVGVPSFILTGLFDLANMILNANIAAYGEESVAALGIVMKAERLPNAINIGICQGMMPIVSYNYASGNKKRMKDTIKDSTILGLAVCFVCLVIFEIFAGSITSVFVNTGSSTSIGAIETIALSAMFLRIRCIATPFQFMNYRSSFCMQAVGEGKGTMIHAIVRELVFYIPFMFILDAIFGRTGLVCSIIAGEFCGMVFAIVLLNKCLRSRKINPN